MRRPLMILILPLFCLLLNKANAQESMLKFSFASDGRGFQEDIIIRADSTFITRSNMKEKAINIRVVTLKKDWEELINAISDNKFIDLESLPSPTKSRALDGAMFSEITLLTNKKEYHCGQFDSYNPHQKLKRLMEVMLKIRDNEKVKATDR